MKFYFLLPILTAPLLLFAFNNCSPKNNEQQNASASVAACTDVPDSLRTPNSISDVASLINALPKPLTIDCFLKSLKSPLNVMAVNNTASAQPAVGNESPRIFILSSNLALSVVPAGIGRDLLEMSEPDGAGQSFKAEIGFPITANIETYDTLVSITDKMSGSSNCVACHRNELKKIYQSAGLGFISDIVRPNEFQRIFSYYLKNQAYVCKPATNEFRCNMLKAIFLDGKAQDAAFTF